MKTRLSILLISCALSMIGQNEYAKWYFGKFTGLDFMTNPPSVINHTTMNTFEGSASVADGAGNLLFYTDGITIWNKQQLVMANGTGLLGSSTTVQSALIVKQPGNANIYYVFTMDLQGGPNGLRYSLVDMNLAAGMGSVTIKNATVTAPCTEQLNATRHCNGVDMWIVVHELTTNQFRSYLLSASGLNLTPVISILGPAPPTFTPNNSIDGQGTIKLSPNGKKLGLTFVNGPPNNEVAVFDFDKSTGIVSNYLSLSTGTTNYWGCEFSPDGTKLYSATLLGNSSVVYQWDLCAGSDALVIASKTNVGNAPAGIGHLQLAPNGKIYLVNWGTQMLSAINQPDVTGPACNYVPLAQSVATGSNGTGLPNFFGGAFKNLPGFTYTINPLISCATVTFTAPPNPTVNTGCGASGYAVQTILWDFGQPSTGPANTSTLNSPTHNFGGTGVFPVKLILNYQCGADTIYQNVSIPGPTISVNSSSVSCTSAGTATVLVTGASGPFTYTWLPSAQTTSAITANPGTHTVIIHDISGNCNHTYTTSINPAQPLTGTVNVFSICNSSTGGAASVNLTMGTGGTGNYVYNWSNAQSTPSVSGLSAGVYTLTVTDANCSFTSTFQVLQAPSVSLSIVSPTGQVCSATLQAIGFSGTPPYSFSWSGGATGPVFVVTQTLNSTAVFTVTITDHNGCSKTETTQVSFLASPPLSVPNRSICANTTATLIASGASFYTWFPSGSMGSTHTVSLNATQVFTVTGSFMNGCSTNTTATVTVYNCTSLKNEEEKDGTLLVYPNPSASKICIETMESLDINVLDAMGRCVYLGKLEKGLNNIDVSSYRSGIYIIRVWGQKRYPIIRIHKID